jgi:TatA/E family protein of Tat protein translocase
MLAFLDSPIQLLVVGVIVLLLFGPDKLPQIAKELGRALRELRRAGDELKNTINLDDRHDSHVSPPRYDSYGNTYNDYGSASNEPRLPSVPEEDVWQPPTPERKAMAATEPLRGDYAASAFADSNADYGVTATTATAMPEANASPADEAKTGLSVRTAESTVPRKG